MPRAGFSETRLKNGIPSTDDWARSWIAGPRRKLERLFPRVAPPEATEKLVRDCRRRVPITRLVDLTPLDRLRLPVFAAVTPLARDLTTHLGKGSSARAAAVSALMEAVERWSAEAVELPRLETSHAALVAEGQACVDPSLYDLPDDATYDSNGKLTWVRGIDLFERRPIWIPLDLVASPPSGELVRHVDTNGLASGNTLLEAVVHGLCEVIERDALSQVVFQTMFGRSDRHGLALQPLETAHLPVSLERPLATLRENDIGVAIHRIDSDIRVPTFRCLLLDEQFPTGSGFAARAFIGCGTAPDAELAALRSVNEAVQSRLAVVQGARDAFNSIPLGGRRPSAESARLVRLSETDSFRSADLMDDLKFLLASLRAAGVTQAVAADLTRETAGVPVVRVRVAGLSGFLVNRRRVGWRVLRHLV